MIFVDDYTRRKFTRFLHEKRDTTEALKIFIADVATPARTKIGIIRTDEGRKIEVHFQELLDELAITHKRIPTV